MFHAFFAFIDIIVWGRAESSNDGDNIVWGT